MTDKLVFRKIEPHLYHIPLYRVIEGKGIELLENTATELPYVTYLPLTFVRGSKVDGENILEKLDGVLIEQLIGICIDHLQSVNTGHLATEESTFAIIKLQEALLWLAKREYDRKKSGTLGTYKK